MVDGVRTIESVLVAGAIAQLRAEIRQRVRRREARYDPRSVQPCPCMVRI
jgi:hypothetical protein